MKYNNLINHLKLWCINKTGMCENTVKSRKSGKSADSVRRNILRIV